MPHFTAGATLSLPYRRRSPYKFRRNQADAAELQPDPRHRSTPPPQRYKDVRRGKTTNKTPDWEELQQGRKCITKEGTNPKVSSAGHGGLRALHGHAAWLHRTVRLFSKRGQPFTFELGAGSVITGWDAAFEKIAVGERALLEIESEWAYGKEGHPPTIPPDSTLHFDVELLSVGEKKKELNMMTSEARCLVSQKFGGLWRFHAVDARLFQERRRWVVSFPILRPFGPRRFRPHR